ncbi:MAG TPA: galactose-1-phosphate uridylyltransferase, partial [Anaerolineales bacterium]|nr:galactose-1-phosphate uridylyltransferase [Anaerolineales bacterium]
MLDTPHRRFNALTDEWVLVSPHRAKRPWLGQVEKLAPEHLPAYDPTCYLCPRNERAGGFVNPDYTGTLVFENDFAALLPDALEGANDPASPLLVAVPERGQCLVVCFSPRHDLTLPELDLPVVENVLATWTSASSDLAQK